MNIDLRKYTDPLSIPPLATRGAWSATEEDSARGINPQFFIFVIRYLFSPSWIVRSMLLSCGAAALRFLLLAAYLRPMMNHRAANNDVVARTRERKKGSWGEGRWPESAERIAVTLCTCVRVYICECMVELQREMEEEKRLGKDWREGVREKWEREKARKKKRSSGRGTRKHGVDRALNPGPTGVLRRSTELALGLVAGSSVFSSWFTKKRTMNPASSSSHILLF